MTYDIKYKERVVEFVKEGHSQKEANIIFKVSLTAVKKWVKQCREVGHLNKKPLNRSFKKIDPEKLKKYIEDHPDAHLSEIADHFKCSAVAIHKRLDLLKIIRKKVKIYKERDENKRSEFREKISALPSENLVFVDETGIDSYIYREFGRAPRGQKTNGKISGKRYKFETLDDALASCFSC